ncbi:type VII secretion-associated serine protease mycosin [Mycolicibacterium sp. CBM1]
MIRAGVRGLAAGCSVVLVMSPSAWALSPPSVDSAQTPPMGTTGPIVPMEQRAECVTTGVIPGTQPGTATAHQQMLNLAGAWQFTRGEGQIVAIIDSGVTPGPRLPNVEPGGDYIATTDGLTDCDGHGTAVAGIIGGQPGADAFSGVAPAARLLSIRQTSAAYAVRRPDADPAAASAATNIATLARAVVRAADLGARVINISVFTCPRADGAIDQQMLGAALRYAAVDRDAVIVAAAGDVGSTQGPGGVDCQANPVNPSADRTDPRNWEGATSISVPSWWQPYVLSVASLTSAGEPSPFSMPGPWLGIAAPGENVVSVGNSPSAELVNGIPGAGGRWTALSGTGYAAAYVSGVAALVRSRFPDMPAAQVIQRLQAVAHNGARDPSNLVGAGTVDPVAALTWELPGPQRNQIGTGPARIAVPSKAPDPDHRPRTVAFAGTAALAVATALTGAAIATRRRKGQCR